MPWLRSFVLLLLCGTLAAAADWPQWLGLKRDGSSSEKVSPWKETPKVLWKQPVGEGHSSPIVAGGRVYLHAKLADKGDVVWKVMDDKASYSSPIAIGQGKERQIVFLTQKGLVGLAPGDGAVLWKFPLEDKLSESSTTPVLAGDLLLGSSVTFGSAC